MKLFAAIDQGTTSSRFIVFDEKLLNVVAVHQLEHRQITPHPGWLSHDPTEIFNNVVTCMERVVEELGPQRSSSIACVGITNQRETTVAWSRRTGNPLTDAIVWSDARTQDIVNRFVNEKNKGNAKFAHNAVGLPCSTYFSAMKMRWMLENVPEVQAAERSGDLMLGTIDSWLIYKLTGGQIHATDVTNASRTMLMDIRSRNWHPGLCDYFGIPETTLPKILPSASSGFGVVSVDSVISKSALLREAFGSKELPISGCIGDQSGALVGQLGFSKGEIKNTFGTGCFLLANVGSEQPVFSQSGLLTTVAFQLGDDQPCFYALEGAVAGAGSAVQWLRDRLKIIKTAKESEVLARSVPNSGGVSFVPAFGGLLAPHWCPGARGTIVGMTQQTTRAHIVRATLEAITQQVASLVECVQEDLSSGSARFHVRALKVDGGMAANSLVMQMQADALGVPVLRPRMLETTAKGAALCAAVGAGQIAVSDLGKLQQEGFSSIEPQCDEAERKRQRAQWKRAVETAVTFSKL